MRRTGKRALVPTMGREGISQVRIAYSIFMSEVLGKTLAAPARVAAKRAYFLMNEGQKKRASEMPVRVCPLARTRCFLHVVRRLAVRVDVQTLALVVFGHAQPDQQIGDLERDV